MLAPVIRFRWIVAGRSRSLPSLLPAGPTRRRLLLQRRRTPPLRSRQPLPFRRLLPLLRPPQLAANLEDFVVTASTTGQRSDGRAL